MRCHEIVRRGFVPALAALLLAQPAGAQGAEGRSTKRDARDLLHMAARGLGGERALLRLRTLQTTSSGRVSILNEGLNPTGEPGPAGTFRARTTYVAGAREARDRWRLAGPRAQQPRRRP